MQGAQIIVLAMPVFLLMMLVEWLIGLKRGHNTYRLNDAVNSIGLGMLSQITGVFTAALTLGIYTEVYSALARWHWPVDAVWAWGLALLLYDFLYYWHHRLGHTCAVLWAAHVVHHQSEDYNLSTALRQTSSGWLLGWLFYLPMAVLGVPPLMFAVVALIDLLYQYWVHTQQVGKLGWFDRWFCSPSNHRVHHAVNDAYLDKNYGGILIVWDRLFGTFLEERDDEPCVYGTREPLRSWNPLWANLEVYTRLWRASRRAPRWQDRWQVWWRPPAWMPRQLGVADQAGDVSAKPFDYRRRARFDPQLSEVQAIRLGVLFFISLTLTAAFLWFAHLMEWPFRAGVGLGLLALLQGLGWLSHGVGSPESA